MYKVVGFEYSVPTELLATHSYFPWSEFSEPVICNEPETQIKENNGIKKETIQN